MRHPIPFRKISDFIYEIPEDFKDGMRVPARIYATEKLINEIDSEVFEQITNVATLPGIVNYALCMPDAHSGYGFPIGGVAAMDPEEGVISPGGIGFDINCGMRLVVTSLTFEDIKPRIKEIVDLLFERVPCGVGSRGFLRLSRNEFMEVLSEGAGWCVVMFHCGSRGFGHQVGTDYLQIFLNVMEKKYSTAHGSGRTMSRTKAKKLFDGKKLQKDMEIKGIYVRTASFSGLAEEAGPAYKDIDEVVEATEMAGISRKVVKFTPIGNIKG